MEIWRAIGEFLSPLLTIVAPLAALFAADLTYLKRLELRVRIEAARTTHLDAHAGFAVRSAFATKGDASVDEALKSAFETLKSFCGELSELKTNWKDESLRARVHAAYWRLLVEERPNEGRTPSAPCPAPVERLERGSVPSCSLKGPADGIAPPGCPQSVALFGTFPDPGPALLDSDPLDLHARPIPRHALSGVLHTRAVGAHADGLSV